MTWWVWAAFGAFIGVMLLLDLGVFHREAHGVSLKEAGGWVALWVGLAAVFCVLVFFWQGPIKTMEFLTGYVIEYSLSIDNLFVFAMVFTYFAVPAEYQHRVLFWGIIGALVMRGLFIAAGTALLAQFQWMIYVFGAFLIYTGIKMGTMEHKVVEPARNPVVRFVRRWVPLTEQYDGPRFLTRRAGRLVATPMFLVLVAVETTDVIFAFDSVPAILGVSRDPFIVWTSNVFAILGLRSLYFLLAGIMGLFHYLKYGLAVILVFIGGKMVVSPLYHFPIQISLGVVVAVVGLSVLASLLRPAPRPKEE